MKKEYVRPSITAHVIKLENCILAGSVQTTQVEFKAHTDSYETETFNWDDISFE